MLTARKSATQLESTSPVTAGASAVEILEEKNIFKMVTRKDLFPE
jgi:hypothetical protein